MNPPDRRLPVSSQASSRSVFVGSIPFDATEEQLIEIFQTAGPVVNFRLVFDRDSGKPKGYGFCEFKDQETAMSAIRNLNGFEFNNRQLRVDFADSDNRNMQLSLATGPNVMGGAVQPGNGAGAPPRPSANTTEPKGGSGWRPTLPLGGGLGLPLQSAKQELPNIADTLNTAQLYEIMAKMKLLVQQNADSARTILVQNPQLTTALLHAQVILGMVKPETVQQIINSTPSSNNPPTIPTPTPTQMPTLPPPMVVPNMMVPPTMGGPMNPSMGGPMGPLNPNINPNIGGLMVGVPPTIAMGGPMNPAMGGPMGAMASMGQMNPMVPMSGPINPMAQINPMGGSMANGGPMKMAGMGSGPMKTMGSASGNINPPSFGGMPANPSMSATPTPSPEQQQVIIQQLVNLTPEQIERLPPAQRHQILNFKQMYQQQQQQQQR